MALARSLFAGVVASVVVSGFAPSVDAFVPPKRRPECASNDMVYVAATSYRFGAEAKWAGPPAGSLPATGVDPTGVEVHVNAFCIDRTEVTAGAYAACVAAGVCPTLSQGDTDRPKFNAACTYGKAGYESHPINCVAHSEAVAYCNFAKKRLPTDVEWELAARGTNGRPFPWGDEYPSPKHLNACDASMERESMTLLGEKYTSMWPDGDDGWPLTAPVGSYPAGVSPYGAFDMSGNVEEWLADSWWEITPAGPPKALVDGGDYVVRGGAFDLNGADSFAVTRRLKQTGGTHTAWLGFRCASDG